MLVEIEVVWYCCCCVVVEQRILRLSSSSQLVIANSLLEGKGKDDEDDEVTYGSIRFEEMNWSYAGGNNNDDPSSSDKDENVEVNDAPTDEGIETSDGVKVYLSRSSNTSISINLSYAERF